MIPTTTTILIILIMIIMIIVVMVIIIITVMMMIMMITIMIMIVIIVIGFPRTRVITCKGRHRLSGYSDQRERSLYIARSSRKRLQTQF